MVNIIILDPDSPDPVVCVQALRLAPLGNSDKKMTFIETGIEPELLQIPKVRDALKEVAKLTLNAMRST